MSIQDDLLHPALEPFQHGWLPVSSLHSIYFEQCGNPLGQPVVVLHGGPGSGCNPGQRRFFDPDHYRIILIDQRGCNRSLPPGCVEENTTDHLLADLESLRIHLDIPCWLVFGGSWGSTLALAYAATHPQSITGLILRGIFLCRKKELDWFLRDARNIFPEAWEQLTIPLGNDEKKDILQTYHHRVFSDDSALAFTAALNWNAYETAIMSLFPCEPPPPSPEAVMIARARVQLHYLVNLCFIASQPLLESIDLFRHIPTIIIQGRYDMVCPALTAYELHAAWPEAKLRIIPAAGHSALEPGIVEALVDATDSFKASTP